MDGQVSFELRDGVFKRLCKDANASPERNFYLIVDEINRGDIPRIFGELKNEHVIAAIRSMAIGVGADPDLAVQDSMPLQYVVKAVPA